MNLGAESPVAARRSVPTFAGTAGINAALVTVGRPLRCEVGSSLVLEVVQEIQRHLLVAVTNLAAILAAVIELAEARVTWTAVFDFVLIAVL